MKSLRRRGEVTNLNERGRNPTDAIRDRYVAPGGKPVEAEVAPLLREQIHLFVVRVEVADPEGPQEGVTILSLTELHNPHGRRVVIRVPKQSASLGRYIYLAGPDFDGWHELTPFSTTQQGLCNY